jgi:ketosteroid isomerase-like protein
MKNQKKIWLVAVMAFAHFLSSAQSNQKVESVLLDEAKKAIAASNAIYFESFVKNDSSIFINRYAEDACIMAPNTPAVCGRASFAKFFKSAYQDYGMRNGKFITTNVFGDGNEFVMEEGLWQSFDANGKLFDDGKFLVLWKKTKKGWMMYRDSFSSNRAQK